MPGWRTDTSGQVGFLSSGPWTSYYMWVEWILLRRIFLLLFLGATALGGPWPPLLRRIDQKKLLGRRFSAAASLVWSSTKIKSCIHWCISTFLTLQTSSFLITLLCKWTVNIGEALNVRFNGYYACFVFRSLRFASWRWFRVLIVFFVVFSLSQWKYNGIRSLSIPSTFFQSAVHSHIYVRR
jgi:hypothetical protein